MRRSGALSGLLAAAAVLGAASKGACQSTAHGEAVFAERCSLCHQLDEAAQGPGLRGVVGRKAATWPDYAYSDALAHSGLIWTPSRLDAFLTNPQAVAPGGAMQIMVADPKDRADLIAYLAQQK